MVLFNEVYSTNDIKLFFSKKIVLPIKNVTIPFLNAKTVPSLLSLQSESFLYDFLWTSFTVSLTDTNPTAGILPFILISQQHVQFISSASFPTRHSASTTKFGTTVARGLVSNSQEAALLVGVLSFNIGH